MTMPEGPQNALALIADVGGKPVQEAMRAARVDEDAAGFTGQLGGPPIFADGFWHMQNAVVNERGWFSQYPPGHVAALAFGAAKLT